MFHLRRSIIIWCALCTQLVWSGQPNRHVEIMNESGKKMEVFWLDPRTGQNVKIADQNVIYNGASYELDSFVDHTFVLREVTRQNETCGSRGGRECHISYVTVSDSPGDQGQ